MRWAGRRAARLLAQAAAGPELRLQPAVRNGGHAVLVHRLIRQVVLESNLWVALWLRDCSAILLCD